MARNSSIATAPDADSAPRIASRFVSQHRCAWEQTPSRSGTGAPAARSARRTPDSTTATDVPALGFMDGDDFQVAAQYDAAWLARLSSIGSADKAIRRNPTPALVRRLDRLPWSAQVRVHHDQTIANAVGPGPAPCTSGADQDHPVRPVPFRCIGNQIRDRGGQLGRCDPRSVFLPGEAILHPDYLGYAAATPPSTLSMLPVVLAERPDAKKRTASAMSSGYTLTPRVVRFR